MTDLTATVDAAQRVAGAIAARHRGDSADAADLLASIADQPALIEGSLLLAELALGLYRAQTGESMDECVQDLCLHMEAALRNA